MAAVRAAATLGAWGPQCHGPAQFNHIPHTHGDTPDGTTDRGRGVDWEPADVDAAGCYSLRIVRKWAHTGEVSEWNRLESACFDLQVRVSGVGGVVDMGQTALRMESIARA